MGRPVLLAAAAALLLLPPPDTGAAVTRLRVSANFVSAGEGRWRGKVRGGRRRAHSRLFACRSAGLSVSRLSERGCSCPPIPAPGGGGIVGLPLPAATGSWRMGGGGAPGFRGTQLPSTPGPRNFLAPGAPRFQRLWIPGALPVSEDSRSSGIPASEDCESPRLPVSRSLNPRGTSLPTTPPRGSPPSKHSQSPGLVLPAGPPAHGRPSSALPLQPTGR